MTSPATVATVAVSSSATAVPTSTTCLAVSQPARTIYQTFTSGEIPIYFIEPTTFTALTTSSEILPATIHAECFTLTPGQTLPSSVPFYGVTCTTYYFPATTEYYTFTANQTSGLNLVTFSYAHPHPTTYVSCSALPDALNPATCDTITPLTWASLVVTFFAIQLSWWIFDIPLLWKKGGVGAFITAISWACVRSHTPCSAGIIAAVKGRDASEFARVYYLGKPRLAMVPPQWTARKYWSCLGADLASVAATAMTLYQACTLSEHDPRRFGMSLWMYPSLPVALMGLCLLAGEHFFPRTKKGNWWLLAMTVSVQILAGVGIAVLLWWFDSTERDMWYLSIIFYSIMLVPVVLIRQAGSFLILGSWTSRVGGVSFAALNHYSGGQPYCKLQGVGFAVVYMVLGAIAAILGVVGAVFHAR
ncbi:hypothetical protein MMYC01_205098 [Madurella mycetomatis]|uniref:Uncharacterized protein n=1 Tax=Madurella mycetomatis TaxID=100816 RepID=A0A175W3U7_9PEZI|nr:hypothetical protein MMYC01_205098 [Madurella mycetomatis]